MIIQSPTAPVPECDLPDLRELWDSFLEARAIAQASNNIADGIRAGKAWARFLYAFVAAP
jgi:hypothetical protein